MTVCTHPGADEGYHPLVSCVVICFYQRRHTHGCLSGIVGLSHAFVPQCQTGCCVPVIYAAAESWVKHQNALHRMCLYTCCMGDNNRHSPQSKHLPVLVKHTPTGTPRFHPHLQRQTHQPGRPGPRPWRCYCRYCPASRRYCRYCPAQPRRPEGSCPGAHGRPSPAICCGYFWVQRQVAASSPTGSSAAKPPGC